MKLFRNTLDPRQLLIMADSESDADLYVEVVTITAQAIAKPPRKQRKRHAIQRCKGKDVPCMMIGCPRCDR